MVFPPFGKILYETLQGIINCQISSLIKYSQKLMYTQFFYGWLLLYKAANDIIHNNTLSTFYSHSFQSLLVACSAP